MVGMAALDAAHAGLLCQQLQAIIVHKDACAPARLPVRLHRSLYRPENPHRLLFRSCLHCHYHKGKPVSNNAQGRVHTPGGTHDRRLQPLHAIAPPVFDGQGR